MLKKLYDKKSVVDESNLSPARLQALVDGIFAIAMTLLVFNIRLPEVAVITNSQDLLANLMVIWPKIFSFIISFILLGVFWAAHHVEFGYIKKLDHKLTWLNIFYLLFVSFFPFVAEILGSYTQNQTAVIFYGVHLIIMVLIHYFMWHHVKNHKALQVENLDPRVNKLADILGYAAIFAYALAIALSFWKIEASLIIYFLVPVPYIAGWIYRLV